MLSPILSPSHTDSGIDQPVAFPLYTLPEELICSVFAQMGTVPLLQMRLVDRRCRILATATWCQSIQKSYQTILKKGVPDTDEVLSTSIIKWLEQMPRVRIEASVRDLMGDPIIDIFRYFLCHPYRQKFVETIKKIVWSNHANPDLNTIFRLMEDASRLYTILLQRRDEIHHILIIDAVYLVLAAYTHLPLRIDDRRWSSGFSKLLLALQKVLRVEVSPRLGMREKVSALLKIVKDRLLVGNIAPPAIHHLRHFLYEIRCSIDEDLFNRQHNRLIFNCLCSNLQVIIDLQVGVSLHDSCTNPSTPYLSAIQFNKQRPGSYFMRRKEGMVALVQKMLHKRHKPLSVIEISTFTRENSHLHRVLSEALQKSPREATNQQVIHLFEKIEGVSRQFEVARTICDSFWNEWSVHKTPHVLDETWSLIQKVGCPDKNMRLLHSFLQGLYSASGSAEEKSMSQEQFQRMCMQILISDYLKQSLSSNYHALSELSKVDSFRWGGYLQQVAHVIYYILQGVIQSNVDTLPVNVGIKIEQILCLFSQWMHLRFIQKLLTTKDIHDLLSAITAYSMDSLACSNKENLTAVRHAFFRLNEDLSRRL